MNLRLLPADKDQGSKKTEKKGRIRQRLQPQGASLLPNLITVSGLCIGFSAVRFALQDRWELAVIAIIVAAFLDAMDGRLARFFGSASRFGAELDSFADFVNFGVSPALLMYLLTLNKIEGKGWMVVLFFTVCSALRLARFNTRSIEGATPQAFFIGVPAPAAAILTLIPLIMYFEWPHPLFISPWVVGGIMIITGLLMVSQMPTYSLKSLRIPHKWLRPSLLGTSLLVGGLFSAPWVVFLLVVFAYILSFPLSVLSWRQQTKAYKIDTKAERL